MVQTVYNQHHDPPPSLTSDCRALDIDVRDIRAGILQTIAYSDLFDYPLTVHEIHRYLVGVQATFEDVQHCLRDETLVPRYLSRQSGYFCLTGRESIVQTRLRRAGISARLWRKATRYGWLIATLPFVRMVAVTGTLAVDNAEARDDIDYLIITEPNRLWLVRSLVIGVVYVGRLERLEICPNYLIASNALQQFDRSLFTAHELAQMIPLYGPDMYRQLLQANAWARCFFPNAFHTQTPTRLLTIPALPKRAAERTLGGQLGNRWEARIQGRKIPQLQARAHAVGATSAVFTPQQCKGHLADHGHQITQQYAERIHKNQDPGTQGDPREH